MAGANAALDAFIAGVERLRTMNEDVAKAAEKDLADVVRDNVSEGVAPDGEAWPDRKEGGKALPGAAAALTSSVKGNTIELKIGPPFVFHNFGAGGSSTTKTAERQRKRTHAAQKKSGKKSKFHAPRRQILPDAGEPLPGDMKDAINEAAERVFGKAMG